MATLRSKGLETGRTSGPASASGRRTARRPAGPRRASRALKHALDRAAAAAALIVTAPLLGGLALALRLRGEAGVLRREERIGEHGRVIWLRSLAITEDMCRSRGWRLFAGAGLTALPQLWSVLRGEMSIVGPRPREPGFDPPPARPGLTGPAQLEQLDRWLSIAEQLHLDEQYARTWSLALDARILWRTTWHVFRAS
jgi:lipopolysaccharide/colanic/teichoic acid biosynthesis glycosyltransferase